MNGCKVDGLRKRAHWSPARVAWYARCRALRFARRMMGGA